MNKKILASLTAIVAVLGLIAGGTFAAWSDFDEYDNSAGAEHLTLDTDARSGVIGFSQEAMAPGVNREFDFVVASRDGQVVPRAFLELTLQNLIGTENGCEGNSETLADGGDCADGPVSGVGEGEFIDEAMIGINVSQPTTSATPCDEPRGSVVTSRPLSQLLADGTVDLLQGDTLAPGEKICVGMGLSLPTATATNASQGDSAEWEFRYDLIQDTTGNTY